MADLHEPRAARRPVHEKARRGAERHQPIVGPRINHADAIAGQHDLQVPSGDVQAVFMYDEFPRGVLEVGQKMKASVAPATREAFRAAYVEVAVVELEVSRSAVEAPYGSMQRKRRIELHARETVAQGEPHAAF